MKVQVIGTAVLAGVLAYSAANMSARAAPAADVLDLRVGQHDGNTRVVLDLDRKATYSVALSEDKRSLVVTLPAAKWKAGDFRRKHAKGLVAGYQYGRDSGGVTRLILTTHEPVSLARQFTLTQGAARKSVGQRLVFDLATAAPEVIQLSTVSPPVVSAAHAVLVGPDVEIAQARVRQPTIEPIRRSRAHPTSAGRPYYTTVPPRSPMQQAQQIQPQQQQPQIIPAPVKSDEGLRLIPRLEYWWFNPSRRDTTSTAHVTTDTIGHLAAGASVAYKGPTEDYIASFMYATGDGDFTGTSSNGSSGFGDIENKFYDMDLDIKKKLAGTPLTLSYGGRWLHQTSKANFVDPSLTFSASNANKLEVTTDYYMGHVGAELSSPLSSTTNDRLFTDIRLGLGYWFREVGNRSGTEFPDNDDLLGMLDLKVGYEIFGSGNFAGQVNYRASFLTLEGLLEDFKIIHGPSANFTYRF